MEAKHLDMEEWEQVFQELIQEVKPWHKWTLETDKDLLPDVLQQGWSQYQQKTFARFRCSSCFRSWASAHVQILFHMHWSRKQGRGQVKVRVFSQSCKRCVLPRFEVPEFTLENIRRVLTNLVFRILKKCYREDFKQMEALPAVKDVNLEGPHDTLHCEACLQGFCTQSGGRLASKPSVPPSLSTLSKDTEMSRATIADGSHPCSPPHKMNKLLVSTVTPKDQNPPKAESKVSHAPKPSAAPRYSTEEVTPMLTATLNVPTLAKTGSKVSHTPKSSAAPRHPTKEVTPTLIVTPKVQSPPSIEDKVHTWLAAQAAHPLNSRTAAGMAWETRATTGEIPPPSPSSGPARPTWGRGCSSWDQRGQATSQVDSRVLMPFTDSQPRCHRYSLLCSGCCLLLILVGLVVAFTVPWNLAA